ncbi:MAG TPA: zinc-ribbon domain-containing protein [Candidatus Hydrogenedentes bacterium]|nr:zinc-ribbon domain-containing protein [Candidatus Hydrogenedentota bacterium]
MNRQIPEGRKTLYYVGTALAAIGLLSFLSTFFTFALHFGDFRNFEAHARSDMLRAFGGMILMIIGLVVRGIGAAGLAGSGVVLDPQRAREDLEPYTRMAGGMVKDAMQEADIHVGASEPLQIVVVKCPSCGKRNEEDAKFCQECGRQL